MKKPTYISLFSSAGVGCYGFKLNSFDCILTSEMINKRLQIQKINNKCKYDEGYISGDISELDVQKQILTVIDNYKKKENIYDVDIVIATPPCQGMSVANHKKNSDEIIRNSLIVEAIKLIKIIHPKFFIFENVQSFMNTNCYDQGDKKTISKAIQDHLSQKYSYDFKVINFKNYGAYSSRTRTLVIGVRKDSNITIHPLELFPKEKREKTLKDIIYKLPRLTEMGIPHSEDIYHNFKAYKPYMREWIKSIQEGESAFNNTDPRKRPHQIIDGKLIPNKSKNGDKYTRQIWNKIAPCIHTRNDILASQNTVHPEDDRVFSIRELMLLMNIPKSFRWTNYSETFLNDLPLEDKCKFLKEHEMNIRQCIGEAIPTVIISQIAKNIKNALY